MKTKRILVGMLACLGMAAGLGAACPPEDCQTSAKVVPMHGLQGVQSLVDHLKGLDPDCCDVKGQLKLQLGDETFEFDGDLQELLAHLHEHIDPDMIQGHLQQLNLDGHFHEAMKHLHEHIDPDTLKHLHGLAGQFNIDLEPALAQLQAFAQPDTKTKSRTRIVTKDADNASGNFVIAEDDNTFAIVLENGKIKSLKRNGKDVDLDNVKKDGDRVKIMGDDGKAVFEFDLSESGGVFTGNMSGWTPAQGQAIFVQAEPPKAMIGVQLGEPNGMLLGHFGLEAGQATLVTGVYDGLPAAEAGLRPYDIIVAVDGQKPAGESEVREALRGRGEGDAVALTVIHRGERKDIKVKLVKYDQEALEKAKLDAVEFNAMAFATGQGGAAGGGDSWFVAPGLGQLRNMQGQDPEKWREFAEAWKKQAQEFAERYKNDPNFKGFQGDMVIPAPPPPPPHQQPQGGGDWQRLEDRLERLEKMIERLAERQAERNRGGGGGR